MGGYINYLASYAWLEYLFCSSFKNSKEIKIILKDFPPSFHFPSGSLAPGTLSNFISSNVPTLFISYSGLSHLLFDAVPVTVHRESPRAGLPSSEEPSLIDLFKVSSEHISFSKIILFIP